MASIYEEVDKIRVSLDRIEQERGRLIREDDLEDAYCDRQHCDDWDCSCDETSTTDSDIQEIVRDYLRKIRMGYTLDVTLRDVLEEMERSMDTWSSY